MRKQQREVMKMAMIRGGGRPGSDGGRIDPFLELILSAFTDQTLLLFKSTFG